MTRYDRIIRLPEILDRCGLCSATIYRRMAGGTFPQRIRLGANSVGWYESEFEEWFRDPAGYSSNPEAD